MNLYQNCLQCLLLYVLDVGMSKTLKARRMYSEVVHHLPGLYTLYGHLQQSS